MNNAEVISLYNIIGALNDKQGTSPQFAYVLIRNKQIIEPIYKALVEAGRASDEFHVYEEARLALCRRMAEKDDKGQPVVDRTSQNFRISDKDNAEFNRQLVELQQKHKSAIDGHKALRKKVDALMKDEAKEVHLIRLSLSSFPTEMTPRQMEALLPIVEPSDDTGREYLPQA